MLTDWRTCRTCLQDLAPARFWKQASRKDGLQSECKACMKTRTTAYHRANRASLRPRNNAATTKKRLADPVRALLASVKYRAKMAGIRFTITEADLQFPAFCPVLGIPLTFGLGKGLGMGLAQRDNRYSVDRIDNCQGYVPGNIVIVSYRANRLKSDATLAEMKAIAGFYEQLEANRAGEATVPGMQPHKEEEEGAVPFSLAE